MKKKCIIFVVLFLCIAPAFAEDEVDPDYTGDICSLPENTPYDQFFDKKRLMGHLNILDIGSGDGATTALMARYVRPQGGLVTGIDTNQALVDAVTSAYKAKPDSVAQRCPVFQIFRAF